MKVKLTILVELDSGYVDNNEDEEKLWMENEVFVGDGNLFLHSNDIGDTVGKVKRIYNIQWINT